MFEEANNRMAQRMVEKFDLILHRLNISDVEIELPHEEIIQIIRTRHRLLSPMIEIYNVKKHKRVGEKSAWVGYHYKNLEVNK